MGKTAIRVRHSDAHALMWYVIWNKRVWDGVSMQDMFRLSGCLVHPQLQREGHYVTLASYKDKCIFERSKASWLDEISFIILINMWVSTYIKRRVQWPEYLTFYNGSSRLFLGHSFILLSWFVTYDLWVGRSVCMLLPCVGFLAQFSDMQINWLF